MVKKKIKIYGFAILLLVLLILPGALLDFRPSLAFAKESAVLGGVMALMFWPFYRRIANGSNNGSFRRVLNGFVVIPLGVAMFGYGASVGTLGFALNRITGVNDVAVPTIVRKGCDYRRCWCDTKIHVNSVSKMPGGSFCIKESLWNRVEVGQQMRFSGVSSRFGFDVNKFEIVR
jgi:hypothetical protein